MFIAMERETRSSSVGAAWNTHCSSGLPMSFLTELEKIFWDRPAINRPLLAELNFGFRI